MFGRFVFGRFVFGRFVLGTASSQGWVRQTVQRQIHRIPGRPPSPPDVDDLLAVLDGVEAAVVAVRTGDDSLIANAAARALYALPDHRPAVLDDLVGNVQVLHANQLRPLGVDDLPLIRALGGRSDQADVVVLAVGTDRGALRREAFDLAVLSMARRLRLMARPLLSGDREVVGSVCTAQDVTDLHTEQVQLTRRAIELDAIHRATRAVLADENARRAVCDVALKVSGALLASLYELDGPDHLVCTTHMGADLEGTRLPRAGSSITAEVFAAGRTRVVVGGNSRHLVADQRAIDRVSPAGRGARLGAAVWLPVTSPGGQCIAVLSLAYAPDVSVGEHLPVLEILAGETAVAIEREDLLRRLRREATSDGLTGSLNRRVWDEELPRALATAERTGTPVSVVMLDFDHFKHYNDAFGHPAGDSLLRDAVAAWRRRLRSTDLLCRYGGEEFVALLPGCGLHEARALAEQLRAVVPYGQTCSAGVAEWNGQESADALVERLDSALYAAKLAGRDRVCAAR